MIIYKKSSRILNETRGIKLRYIEVVVKY